MFCLYTFPLARPAQAKIQMLITSSWIVTILLNGKLISDWTFVCRLTKAQNLWLLFLLALVLLLSSRHEKVIKWHLFLFKTDNKNYRLMRLHTAARILKMYLCRVVQAKFVFKFTHKCQKTLAKQLVGTLFVKTPIVRWKSQALLL